MRRALAKTISPKTSRALLQGMQLTNVTARFSPGGKARHLGRGLVGLTAEKPDVHEPVWGHDVIRVGFTWHGKPMVGVRFKGGPVELYRVDDGRETFVGYCAPRVTQGLCGAVNVYLKHKALGWREDDFRRRPGFVVTSYQGPGLPFAPRVRGGKARQSYQTFGSLRDGATFRFPSEPRGPVSRKLGPSLYLHGPSGRQLSTADATAVLPAAGGGKRRKAASTCLCVMCGKAMDPAAWQVRPVCVACDQAGQRRAAGGGKRRQPRVGGLAARLRLRRIQRLRREVG